ncbi:MAG: serine/threonine protein kinase [Acidobacteria bacterium]|nr:serine/threonine protein kinase [Acidobacteriota bacterium]
MKECPGCHRCFPDHVNHCPSDGESLKFTLAGDTVLDERYQLERRLGQGGMGIVFKARHVFLKTHHAVKVILPDLVGNDPSLLTRFRQEAMAAAAIRHQNTVTVTDYGVIGGTTPFLVMEFIEGRSLHDILAQQKRLSPAQAVEIMLAVCAGVAAAHRQGIVHRDLKPLNILLQTGHAPGEGVKVLDFGLAKIKSGELLGSFVAAQTQGMMGSPFYMAPEQWGDDDIDVRADIYSLGIILYQMLSGDVPFRGVSIPSIMNKHLTTAPVPLSEREVEVPAEIERAVQHALAKDPERRPQTVEEFMEELRAAMCSVSAETPAGDAASARTVPLVPGETVGLSEGRGVTTGGQHSGSPSFETVAGVRDIAAATGALEEESGPESVGKTTVAQIEVPRTDALPEGGNIVRGADTARQPGGGHTAAPLGGAGETTPRISDPVGGGAADAPTSRLPDAEDQRRVEESRRRAAEERAAAEALAAQKQAAGAHAGAPTPTPAPSPTPLIALAVLVVLGLLAGIGGLAYYLASRGGTGNTNENVNAGGATNINAGAQEESRGLSPLGLQPLARALRSRQTFRD